MANIVINQLSIGTKRILGNQVTISGTKNNDTKPNANGTNLSQAITQSFENPKYVISGVKDTGVSGMLTYADVLTLYQAKYDNTNAGTLIITYGTASTVPSITSSTQGAKVVLESYNITYDCTDSKNAYLPNMTLTFVETK
jgi:hypothetical protein